MAVRQDRVQLNIEFITDESRALAKANTNIKALSKELRSTLRAGGDVSDVMRRIVLEGGKIEDLDLSRVSKQQLVALSRQLEFTRGRINQNTDAYKRLTDQSKRVNDRLAEMRKETRGVAGAFGGGRTGLIGRIGGVIAVATAAIAAFRGLFSVIAGGVRRAAEFEQLNVALGTFLGSAEKAREVIKDLTQFSIATPFEPEQVNRAGKALLAFGIEQEKLIPSLRQIGDVAAGTGKDFNELTLIYGKARAAGRIQGEELNQLAEAGIPIYEELGKVVGRNASEIRKLGEQGKLSFEDLQAVFTNLTSEGGRFNGLLEKQSKTLTGLASTAKGAFAELSRNLAGAFTPLLKAILPPIIGLVNRITAAVGPLAAAVGNRLVLAFQFLQRVFAPLVESTRRLFRSFSDIAGGTGILSEAMRLLGAVLSLVVNLVSSAVAQVSRLLNVFSFFGGGSGGIIQKVLTSPLKFAIEVITQFVAVLNGLVSASRVAFDSIGNIGSVFFNTIALAFDQIKGLFTDNEAAIAARQNSLASAYAGLGKKLGDAFREGYQNALGDGLPGIDQEAASGSGAGSGAIVTRSQDAAVSAADRRAQEKVAKETARIAKLRAERALDTAAASIDGSTLSDGVDRRGIDAEIDAINDRADREADALQRARNRKLIDEEQFQLARLELRRNTLAQEQEVLREGTDEEVRLAFEKGEQIKAIEQDIFEKKEALAEREKALRQSITDTVRQSGEEALSATISLLARDEAARKRNSAAIKAFKKGEAIISGIAKLAAIREATEKQAAAASTLGPLAAIPVYVAGAIRAAAAIAQTAATVGKINAAKFARGGTPKFGRFGGKPHSAGGTQLYGDDGTHIEVERDETFAIVNKNARGLLDFLSDVNQRTGGVAFARGGVALTGAPSTTPLVSSATLAASAATAPDNAALLDRIDRLTEVTASMQTRLRAVVVTSDLDEANADSAAARAASEV